MTTNDKIALRNRSRRRIKHHRKRAEKVSIRSAAIGKTTPRTPVQVSRLTQSVNSATIVNARKDYDKKLGLDRRNEKGQLMAGRRSRQLMKKVAKGRFSMKAFRKALMAVENERDKVPMFEHFIRRAYHDDTVLKALLNKLLPDLKSVDARVTQESPFRLIIDLGERPQTPLLGVGETQDD